MTVLVLYQGNLVVELHVSMELHFPAIDRPSESRIADSTDLSTVIFRFESLINHKFEACRCAVLHLICLILVRQKRSSSLGNRWIASSS